MSLSELLPAIGGTGAVGGLIFLIGYLFAANRTDRKEYRSAIKEEETARDETEKKLDEERALRRKTEDALAETRRQLVTLTAQVEQANLMIQRQTDQIANQAQQIANLEARIALLTGGEIA